MHIHVDMIGGLAGDMFLAAAIDAGLVDTDDLEQNLRTLGLGEGITIVTERVRRGALSGTHVRFQGWDPEADADHRHLSTIESMIAESKMTDQVKATATDLFRRLGRSESKVHDIPMERVHFHEVGAVDSILDFCSAAYVIANTQATWSFGPVPMGTGSIQTAHGTIPVPAPATADLLLGLPAVQHNVEAELVTPTGAAVLQGLPRAPRALGTIDKIGYGAGTRELGELSNVVRFMVSEPAQSTLSGLMTDTITRLECELDDMTAEAMSYAEQRLFERGAVDVCRTPVHMKKGRTGTRLTVLCTPDNTQALTWCILRETSSLGVRVETVSRFKLARRLEQVSTPYGDVLVKVALVDNKPLKAAPEFEDVAAQARAHNVPFGVVYDAAMLAWSD